MWPKINGAYSKKIENRMITFGISGVLSKKENDQTGHTGAPLLTMSRRQYMKPVSFHGCGRKLSVAHSFKTA